MNEMLVLDVWKPFCLLWNYPWIIHRFLLGKIKMTELANGAAMGPTISHKDGFYWKMGKPATIHQTLQLGGRAAGQPVGSWWHERDQNRPAGWGAAADGMLWKEKRSIVDWMGSA